MRSRERSITVSYKDVDFYVEYDYSPAEKMVKYYSDGHGYPGCDTSIEINFIEYEGRDMSEYFADEMGYFELEIWEQTEPFDDYI